MLKIKHFCFINNMTEGLHGRKGLHPEIHTGSGLSTKCLSDKYPKAADIFFPILEKAERCRFFEYEGESVIVEDVTDMLEE